MRICGLFGLYAIVEGALNIAAAVRWEAPRSEPRWALLREGIVSLAAGVLTFIVPGITALWLLHLIAAWSVVKGCDRRGGPPAPPGLLLIAFPGAGALAVLSWIGAHAIAFGVVWIAGGREAGIAGRPATGSAGG